MQKIFFIVFILGFSSLSCTVTNNFYFNDPKPYEKGQGEGYLGVGTGLQAEIDSISFPSGAINFSERVSTSMNLVFGGQVGLGKKYSVRFSGHLPKLLGGFGLRGGLQKTLFDSTSNVNISLGFDMGFVLSKDSVSFLRTRWAVNKETNSALNADGFFSLSLKTGEYSRLIITPRYSFNTLYIRKYKYEEGSVPFGFQHFSLSLGLKAKKIYLEATGMFLNDEFIPHFGIARIIN